MTLGNFRLHKSLIEYSDTKEDSATVLSGILGLNSSTVQVPNREGFVYVRLRDNLHEVIEAYNGVVSPVYNLPVLIRWDKTRYVVSGRDLERYVSWGTTSAYLPLHGASHSFSESGGGDVVWVYSRQFMPWLITPSGSSAANTGMVQGYPYYFESQWKYLATTGTPNLLGNLPTGGNDARMMLVYLDQKSNILKVSGGEEFSSLLTGTADIVPHIPSVTQDWYIPLAGVRVTTGTSIVNWGNLYDLRPFFTAPPTGTGGGGGGGASFEGFSDGSVVFVEDEQAQEDNPNFSYVDSANVLVLGNTGSANVGLANTRLSLQGNGGAVGQEIRVAAGAASFPYLYTYKANGTFESPTAIQSGDLLSRIDHFGYDGSNYVDKARVDVYATETWGASARGTKYQIRTTPTGTAGTQANGEWIGSGLSLLKGLKTGQLVETAVDYIMDGEDCIVITTQEIGNLGVVLPPATNKSQIIYIKVGSDLDEGEVNYSPQGSDTVDGLASGTFQNNGDYIACIADGVDTWHIVSQNISFNTSAVESLAGDGLIADGTELAVGTPGSVTGASTNDVTADSHTHELDITELDVSRILTGGDGNDVGIDISTTLAQTEPALRVAGAGMGSNYAGFNAKAALFYGKYTTQTLSAGDSIDPNQLSHVRIQGNGGAVELTSDPQIISGTSYGQLLLLESYNATNPVTLSHGRGIHLNSNTYKMYKNDWATFVWSNADLLWTEVSRSSYTQEQSWSFRSRASGSAVNPGITYAMGYYKHAYGGDTFDPSVQYGSDFVAYGAKVYLVLGQATVDVLTIQISGAQIQSDGSVLAGQAESIVIPSGTSANTYFETTNRWVGKVVIAKLSGTEKSCNYGFVNAWNNGKTRFVVTGFDANWYSVSADDDIDIRILHHKHSGWTAQTGSVASPPTFIASMKDDYGNYDRVSVDDYGSWHRDSLAIHVSGTAEGIILMTRTTEYDSIVDGNISMQYRTDW